MRGCGKHFVTFRNKLNVALQMLIPIYQVSPAEFGQILGGPGT